MCVCIYMIHINTAHKYRQPLDDALARELCVETRDGVSHGGVHGGVGHGLEGLDGMPWQHLSIVGRKRAQSYSLQTRVSSRFESGFVERQFQREFWPGLRFDIVMWLLLHCCQVACQFGAVVSSTISQHDFASLGAPDVERRKQLTLLMLTLHLAFTMLLALAMLVSIALGVLSSHGTRHAAALVLLLRSSWVVTSTTISAARLFNMDGWLLAFPAMCCSLTAPMITPNADATVIFNMVNTMSASVVYFTKPHYEGESVAKIYAAMWFSFGMGTKVLLWRNWKHRRNWSLVRLVMQEHKGILNMLQTLLPKDIALAIYGHLRPSKGQLARAADDVDKSHDAPPFPLANELLDVCTRRRAIVLQVDICGECTCCILAPIASSKQQAASSKGQGARGEGRGARGALLLLCSSS